ncbi:glycosyltransferase [Macrococcus lamae]|uniref:Glycosyltransferase n=1 Tax=Macrococcus lamae TaxID=198484 RepID=A0A4R6BVK1_9STAP|nr:glycosyltransferase [Macrococcus lamae]TDM12390.1 glycosyltransferase [Macrococcus lamae]
MKLSVIVPVYNVEEYLAQCLDSILMQSVPESRYEIILVNDSSPDNSLAVAEQYQAAHPHIKIITQNNGGIAAARNTGLKAASGEYIVLLDSDDFYSADFFGKLYELIDTSSQPDVILFDFNYFYSQDDIHEKVKRSFSSTDINGKSGQDVLNIILAKEPLFTWFPWTYAVKRTLIEDNDLYFVKNRNYEDMMWTPLLFLNAQHIMYLNIPAVEYRLQRDGQITGTISYKNLVDPIFAPHFLKEKMSTLQVPSVLENKILRNTANKYFIAPLYAGHLTYNERMQLIHTLKENKELLAYTSSSLSKVVSMIIKWLGFKNAVYILDRGMRVYQLLKPMKERRNV